MGIAVPVRNAGRWLDELLISARAQTYREWRLVVVDDGSDDGSLEIARRHAKGDERIRACSGSGSGRGAPLTRNEGRALLGETPPYLYFPDADDMLEPELLARLVARLEADPSAVAAFCSYRRIDEAGRPLNEPPPHRLAMSRRWARRLSDDEAVTPFESLYGCAPAPEAVIMFRADAFDAAGGWPVWSNELGRWGGESIDLLCRLALTGPVLFEPLPLYRYRRHGGQFSGDAGLLTDAAAAIREAWRLRARTDSTVRPVVEHAEFFVEHRLVPRVGLEAAWRHARSGNLLAAAHFLGGAARRYRWREVSEHRPGRALASEAAAEGSPQR